MTDNHPAARSVPPLLAVTLLGSCGSGGATDGSSEIDTIPPQPAAVRDGIEGERSTQTETTEVSANWDAFVDNSGAIDRYEWAIGTTPGGTEVQDWQNAGQATTATNSDLTLTPGVTYFTVVRAFDPSGNVSTPASSNGVLVEEEGGGTGGPTNGGTVMASSLTQFGITWTFAEPESVGQFANGDWWVVGPVEIVGIDPPSQEVNSRVINGSMTNPDQDSIPGGKHGYDSELFSTHGSGRFESVRNVAWGVSPQNPLTLTADTSLISSVSWTESTPPANGSQSQLKTAAVLTVLATEAPDGSFRPPYSGHDKSIRYNVSDLDFSSLGTLASAAQQPDFADTLAQFERPWLDHCASWVSRYMHPIENMPDYSRNFTALYGTGALMLQLDIPNEQKRELLIRLTQIGIDFFANLQHGGYWTGVGGQCSGRKFPILFAGRVLNDGDMLSVGALYRSEYFGPGHPSNSPHFGFFGEDCQTFYVEQTSPGVYNWGHGNYNASHFQLPEWGASHTQYPQYDDSEWMGNSYRRCCTANAWVGQTIAARVMGLVSIWDHPAYFDYMDRYMQIEPAGEWTRSWVDWHGHMWDLHRPSL